MKQQITPQDVVLPAKRQDEPTLEGRMSENAYNNILPARYQCKDEDGNLIEEQEDVFHRVAKNVALADLAHVDGILEVGPSEYRPEFRDEFPDDEDQVAVTEDNVKYLGYDLVLDILDDDTRDTLVATANEFHDLMRHLAFMPNTPTLINAGDELQQLSACFVDSPADDMDDIHDTAREAAKVFQSGGGMGYAFWKLRPYGDTVGSTGGIASGPITFMRTYDQMCKTIAQGGARRGAQMGVMKVSHPDVIEFIHAKNKDVSLAVELGLNDPKDPTNTSFSEALEEARELMGENGEVPKYLRNAVEGHLSNFNISVGVTHDFMDAVMNDGEFTFTNPRTEEEHIVTHETAELWSRYGYDLEVGEPLTVDANRVWDDIIEGAYENGEPGVIFLDRVNDEHSFDVDEYPEHEILATNPCGEQPLEEYEACNLAHINLSTLARDDSPDWRKYRPANLGGTEEKWDEENLERHVRDFLGDAIDWAEFDRRIHSGTHFLDNVVTMSNFPIPEIEEKVTSMRKIGLGIMGYAQLLIQIGVEYGSPVGNEVARQLMTYINHTSKETSHQLAKERGVFEAFAESKYARPSQYPEWFEEHTGQDSDDWAGGFPVRNHNTTTIAPTGTTGMLGNTSSGCEPIYQVAYLKNVSQDIQGDDELVEFDDYFLRVLEANDIDVDQVQNEVRASIEAGEFEGVDSLDSVPTAIGSLFVTTGQLTGREHASVQCAFQEGVDSAISKTVNFPNHATRDDVRDVYEYIYCHGGKGVTVYRDGSRETQVISTSSNKADADEAEDEERESVESDAPETKTSREVTHEYLEDEYGVGVDYVEGLVTGDLDDVRPDRVTPRALPEKLRGTRYPISTGYGELSIKVFEDENGDPFEVWAEIGKSGGFTHSFTEGIGRLASVALRCGVPAEEIIDQLDGIRSPKTAWHNGQQIQSVPDAVAFVLEKHVEEGGNPTPEPQEETSKNLIANGGQQQTDGSMKALENGESPECLECGSLSLSYKEGCKTCEACGWSQCG